jgi:hypothetical protein
VILEQLTVVTNPTIQFTYPEYSTEESDALSLWEQMTQNISECARRCWCVNSYFILFYFIFVTAFFFFLKVDRLFRNYVSTTYGTKDVLTSV